MKSNFFGPVIPKKLKSVEKVGIRAIINPSCTKVFGTHTFYEGRGGGGG